jgi:hypothetical protein
MKKVNDISDELKSMGSCLADMSRVMPYSVPQGYFEHFAGSTLETIKELNQSAPISAWGKSLPYKVPVNYFEGLTGAIVAAAKAEEGLSSPATKETPYKVPSGYFESLPEHMLRLAKAAEPAKKETKIIPLRRSYYLRTIKWAAAAVFVAGIGLGSLRMYLNNGQIKNPDQILASVSGNEIKDYLQHTYRVDIDKVVENSDISNIGEIDSKDIIQYLDETGWDATE